MSHKKPVIVFDVIETVFSLKGLSSTLQSLGLPEHTKDLYFAELKRYDIIKKLTFTIAAIALAFSAGHGSQADRHNERGYQSTPVEQSAVTRTITE